jgi:hypothetical protein
MRRNSTSSKNGKVKVEWNTFYHHRSYGRAGLVFPGREPANGNGGAGARGGTGRRQSP